MAIAYELFLPVAQAMRETGKTITEPVRLSGDFGATQKSDKSIVTIADPQAQAFLTQKLSVIVPGSKVLGEETFDKGLRWQDSPLLKDKGDVFVIDPIDGTRRFARGDDYGIMGSHRRGGQVRAAWVYFPVTDEMLFASERDKTQRVTWDAAGRVQAQPLPPIPEVPLSAMTMRTHSRSWGEDPTTLGPFGPLKALVREVKRSECIATEIRTMLTTGAAVQFMNYNTPWDREPVVFLAERAGAPQVVDFKGKPASDDSTSFIMAPNRPAMATLLAEAQRLQR